jgi:D-aminopeptidase
MKKKRAREAGLPLPGEPGPLNALTDLPGVLVGSTTIISAGDEQDGRRGPVRTGVTAILPRGRAPEMVPVWAGVSALNGNGEMTGSHWITDGGHFFGPICLTNTHSVGIVHHAATRWMIDTYPEFREGHVWALPVVAETYDGLLSDINAQAVSEAHVASALDTATGGPVPEGNVGGGTGMICHQFKGGIGTASRRIEILGEPYTLGALVQCNYGSRRSLRIAGVPVGREISDLMPSSGEPDDDAGSIIVVVGTDAPVLPHQLKRVARRISLGLARNGSTSGNGSGDIFIAFSTANRDAARSSGVSELRMLPNGRLNPLFTATVEATEEAIVNALVAAETMTGADGVTVSALPHDRLREILRRYNRLADAR